MPRPTVIRLLTKLTLHATDGSNRVCSRDRLAGIGLTGQGCLGIPAGDARLLGPEMQDQAHVAIIVHVLDVSLLVGNPGAIRSE